MATFLQIAIPIGILLLLVQALRVRGTLSRSFKLYKKLRVRHYLHALASITLVSILTGILWRVPALRWGWWAMLGGHGNILTGNSEATSSGPLTWIPVMLVGTFLLVLPVLAQSEEEATYFGRVGSEKRTWAQRWKAALGFGLLHMSMGIPIAVALALTAAGMIFTLSYLRGRKKFLQSQDGYVLELVTPQGESLELEIARKDIASDGTYTYEYGEDESVTIDFDLEKPAQTAGLLESALTHTAHNTLLLLPLLALSILLAIG